jgi:hypothetical protein
MLVKSLAWKPVNYGINDSALPEGVTADSQEASLWRLSGVKSSLNGKPVVLFIETTEKKVKGTKTSLIPEAEESLKVEEKIFYEERCKTQIVGRLFTCLRMDLASVNKDQNKYLYSEKAPFVAVYDAKGNLVGVSRSLGGTLNYMNKAISPQGVDPVAMYSEAFGQLSKYGSAVEKHFNAKKDHEKVLAASKKKTTKASQMKLAEAKEKVDKLSKIADEEKAKFDSIIEKYASKMQTRVASN